MDARLLALFKSIEAPAPSAGFAARTMNAVKREALPAGRRPLRSPLASFLGWAALIAGVADFRLGRRCESAVVRVRVHKARQRWHRRGRMVDAVHGRGARAARCLQHTGLAVSRAVVTREGSAGLLMIAVNRRVVVVGAAPAVDVCKCLQREYLHGKNSDRWPRF